MKIEFRGGKKHEEREKLIKTLAIEEKDQKQIFSAFLLTLSFTKLRIDGNFAIINFNIGMPWPHIIHYLIDASCKIWFIRNDSWRRRFVEKNFLKELSENYELKFSLKTYQFQLI